MPGLEAFENSKQFLVMCVVIELGIGEGMRVECNRMDLAIGSNGGNNAGNGIVRSISFNQHGFVRGPMH